MRNFLTKNLGAKTGRVTIELFSVWHIMYLVLIVGAIVGVAFFIRKKAPTTQNNVLKNLALVTLALYIADFFLQPFVNGDPFALNIDKLPFHICTCMGIVAVFAQFSHHTWLQTIAVVLAVASTALYLVYPGSALGGVTPWCYLVVQTMLYHGLLLMWGVLNLTTGAVHLQWKKIWQPLLGIIVVALWATVGNVCYNSSYLGDDGKHHWDWLFLTGSTFSVPAYLMPLVVIALLSAVVCLVYLVDWLATRDGKKQPAPLSR
ncbi:MAG: YwaF family protein [Prevotella sp.]|nr:YwaF family protein [Prevotella sp.]